MGYIGTIMGYIGTIRASYIGGLFLGSLPFWAYSQLQILLIGFRSLLKRGLYRAYIGSFIGVI